MGILKKKKKVPKKKKEHPKVANFKKKVKKAVGKVNPKAVPYADLLPFKKMMSKQLTKKGIAHGDQINQIAPLFLNHIVRKRNFNDRHGFSSIGKDSQTFNIVEEVAEGIVKAILNFIKGLIQHRKEAKAGQAPPMKPDEAEMLNDAEEGVKEASDAEDEDEEKNKGGFFSRLLEKIFPARANHK